MLKFLFSSNESICCIRLVFFFLFFTNFSSAIAGDFSISYYGGNIYDNSLSNLIFKPRRESDFKFKAYTVGKRLWTNNKNLDFEIEGQFVRHLGPARKLCPCSSCLYSALQGPGKQKHNEFNAVFILRWLKFPWNNY